MCACVCVCVRVCPFFYWHSSISGDRFAKYSKVTYHSPPPRPCLFPLTGPFGSPPKWRAVVCGERPHEHSNAQSQHRQTNQKRQHGGYLESGVERVGSSVVYAVEVVMVMAMVMVCVCV